MTSMAGASKFNTSHQHHCHGQNSMVQPTATTASHCWGGLVFPKLLSLSLFLFIFLFFCCCSLIYGWKFLFLFPACLWAGDLVSFWDLMIWKNKGFWFAFGGVRKKGFLFWVLGVQKVGFLAWVWLCFCIGILGLRVFYGWMCVCYVLCNACEVWTRVKSSHEHNTHSDSGYWLNHGVSTMAIVLVACIEL